MNETTPSRADIDHLQVIAEFCDKLHTFKRNYEQVSALAGQIDLSVQILRHERADLQRQLAESAAEIAKFRAERDEEISMLVGVGPILCRNQKEHPREEDHDCLYCVAKAERERADRLYDSLDSEHQSEHETSYGLHTKANRAPKCGVCQLLAQHERRAAKCVRCGAPYLPYGQCSRHLEGCQGGIGEGRDAKK